MLEVVGLTTGVGLLRRHLAEETLLTRERVGAWGVPGYDPGSCRGIRGSHGSRAADLTRDMGQFAQRGEGSASDEKMW